METYYLLGTRLGTVRDTVNGRHDPCLTSYYEAACVMCQKPGTN